MTNYCLTENMNLWLKELYLKEAEEQLETASNCHIVALGSDSQESAIQWEEYADEHREFANILESMAKELELD